MRVLYFGYQMDYYGPEEWYNDEDAMLADADNYGADDKGGFEWLSKSI